MLVRADFCVQKSHMAEMVASPLRRLAGKKICLGLGQSSDAGSDARPPPPPA